DPAAAPGSETADAHRAAQQRVGPLADLEHDELPGTRGARDGRGLEAQEEMIGCGAGVGHDACGDVERHGRRMIPERCARAQRGMAPRGRVLRCGDVTPPKLVLQAFVAGLYGGILLERFLRLANERAAQAQGLRGILAVVLGYALAAAVVWP